MFTHSIGAPHIAAAGDPWQIDEFVRPALAGRKIVALGVTEPGTGSDVGAITPADSRMLGIGGGTNEIMNELIAEHVVDRSAAPGT